MHGARDRPDLGAVEEVEGDNTAPACGSDPGEHEHVRIQKRLASLPPIRSGRVYVEVPKQTDTKGLQRRVRARCGEL